MVKHELYCNANPINFRACSGCVHLEEREIDYCINSYMNGDHYQEIKTTKTFYCNKLIKLLYPFKVEKMGLVNKYPKTFDGQDPMPNECEDFEEFSMENIFY